MTTIKYSRQREAIKEYLSNTTAHPTAEMVHSHIKKNFPRISLGTVYRNLSLLAKMGELQQLPCVDGADRFDGDTTSHAHFYCSLCNRVLDLELPELRDLIKTATTDFKGQIDSEQISFYGLCPKCSQTQY